MSLSINKKKEIIKVAFQHSVSFSFYLNGCEDIPVNVKNFYEKKINPNAIHDKDFVKNTKVYDYVNWDLLERNKAIRLLSRDIELLNFLNIKKYNFSILELFPIFINHPELIEYFIEDFSAITPIEAIRLLECNEDLIEKIDISKFNFNKKDMLEIINKFKDSEEILQRLDLSKLDNYNTKKLILKTGVDYVDRLNTKQLTATDWLDILEKQKELINFCDLSIFERGDCYLLTKLVAIFPNLYYLIIKNSDKISPLGWENLIKLDYETYSDFCKWEKLSELNWKNLIKVNPEISIKKQRYFIF